MPLKSNAAEYCMYRRPPRPPWHDWQFMHCLPQTTLKTMPDSAGKLKRKRTPDECKVRGENVASSASTGSSSSDDDCDDTGNSSSCNVPNGSSSITLTNTSIAASPANKNNTKEGWRVKLYRLNTDGSWDDCGTGRITCAYRNSSASDKQQHAQDNTATPTIASSSNPDQWLYHETGEATLVVTAEPLKPSGSEVTSQQHRLLLRTRILLRDAYQRQGENIITWCEPFFSLGRNDSNNNISSHAANVADGDAMRTEKHGNVTGEATSTNTSTTGVDLALSFQDNEGCLDVWRQIQEVQSKAARMMQTKSVQDLAAQVAAQHHADLCQQQERDMLLWNSNSNTSDNDENGNSQHSSSHGGSESNHRTSELSVASSGMHHQSSWAANAVSIESANSSSNHNGNNGNCLLSSSSLPQPPTIANLEDVADSIATLQHVHPQREALAMCIAQDDCAYLTQLLEIFAATEARGNYSKLATLAACVKTILLLNEPAILELIVTEATLFEQVCSCLEYDPDLREKANHRWFLRERARFRTVVPMEDDDLVGAIHRSFRVSYLRDTLLRPTMDESTLSTLTSLQTFTHADVVKGVTMSPGTELEGGSLYDSYLVRVIDMLCAELHAISAMEWAQLETRHDGESASHTAFTLDPSIVFDKYGIGASHTKQYLAPQDGSLASRKMRRRGCLLFLKELFTMVRTSLQQSDKDDFISVICTLDIDLNEGREIADNVSQTSQQVEVGSVASTTRSDRLDEKLDQAVSIELHSLPSPTNLLSMLGNVLADPGTELSEKCAALDILAGVAMHDSSLIRRHCLEFHTLRTKRLHATLENVKELPYRPVPNERNQVLFVCPPDDLIMALLYTVAVERDAGMLLQVTEVLRIVLDTDMMNDQGPVNAGVGDEADDLPHGHVGQQPQPNPLPSQHYPGLSGAPDPVNGSGEKHFLSVFYENYAEWLVAPFQFQILRPAHPIPSHVIRDPTQSEVMQEMILTPFRKSLKLDEKYVTFVVDCSIRRSFAVELLSFCVRAHTYRMKFFLLRSKVIGSVLQLLRCGQKQGVSNSRALKLAVLRFFRAILSANDESYHRHIVQHDLFAPVFEALRMNPVGDNLLSSAIVEMCDYIHSENINSLVEYIVKNHLQAKDGAVQSLEDVSSPYVNTLTMLRKAYEESEAAKRKSDSNRPSSPYAAVDASPTSPRHQQNSRQLSGRALADQRKFRELDEEESYFDSEDDFDQSDAPRRAVHLTGDEGNIHDNPESELHRTPRMFSLAQTTLLENDGTDCLGGPILPKSPPLHDNEESRCDHSPPTV
ncbi:hypothetical protein MPSEU_000731800 [Mayamaea pseudoterrestris]|nr:hypothetical protein MPSEU_000731800 [Mayamaea pseudoterrestris]